MKRTALILDCDTGVDDAIALLLAFASPDELDLIAVTTVAGNVGADLTARNSRIIRQIAGREDVPVYAGADGPLARPPIAASHFHGESGLGTLEIFEPRVPVAQGHAVNAIIQAVMSRPAGAVAMAVTGPMTNLALALKMEPAIAKRLGRVAVMGGARRAGGNVTASAEYNIYADPHAARIVFDAGLDLTLLGLDCTHQVCANEARTAAIAAIDTPTARAVSELLDFMWGVQKELVKGWPPPMHDPCTVAYLMAPHLFTTEAANVQVETESALTLGHTSVEFRAALAPPNAQWAITADADAVFEMMTERFAR